MMIEKQDGERAGYKKCTNAAENTHIHITSK